VPPVRNHVDAESLLSGGGSVLRSQGVAISDATRLISIRRVI